VVKLRTRPRTNASGVVGTARTDRRTAALLSRLSEGDVAVLDEVDLDGPTAEALVDTGVVAVLNRSPMISGRFPNRGPQILLDAGIVMLDQLSAAGGQDPMVTVGDGRRVKVVGASVVIGDEVVAEGREVTADVVAEQLAGAHTGLATQLHSLTHNSVEFLRREEPLLLHGEGVPRLRTKLAGRPVVVIGHGPDDAAELKLLRRYLREVRPVVVTTGEGLVVARAAGLTPDVLVLDSRIDELPAARAMRAARDVVVTEPPGALRGGSSTERFERVGVRTVSMRTTAAPTDAALLLADAAGATPIVAVGVRGTVEEYLDSNRDGLGSGYVTRLKVGPRLVDASAVPLLYTGQLRARHAYVVLLIGLVAVAAAVATTQVGHQWALDLRDQLHYVLTVLRGRVS
jgi:uncharacterized membrane-anchored protein